MAGIVDHDVLERELFPLPDLLRAVRLEDDPLEYILLELVLADAAVDAQEVEHADELFVEELDVHLLFPLLEVETGGWLTVHREDHHAFSEVLDYILSLLFEFCDSI